jgi:hypothetical protein
LVEGEACENETGKGVNDAEEDNIGAELSEVIKTSGQGIPQVGCGDPADHQGR